MSLAHQGFRPKPSISLKTSLCIKQRNATRFNVIRVKRKCLENKRHQEFGRKVWLFLKALAIHAVSETGARDTIYVSIRKRSIKSCSCPLLHIYDNKEAGKQNFTVIYLITHCEEFKITIIRRTRVYLLVQGMRGLHLP